MTEKELIQLLSSAGDFDLKCSEKTDRVILNNIYNTPSEEESYTWKEKLSSAVLLRPVLAVLVLGIIAFFIVNITSTRNAEIDPQKLYDRIISQIQQINMEKDIERALNIYSEDFFKQNNKDELKKNIETLFRDYVFIKYEPTREKVIIRNNNALIENNIRYYAKALNKNNKSLSYQGKERIYLKRYRDKWKIVAWVYDEK